LARLRLAVLSLALALAGLGAVAAEAGALELPPGFRDEKVLGGLQEPTSVRFAPDGRVFVAEKAGRVVVFDDLEDPTPTEFADLTRMVYDHSDRGLLGMVLDPEFDAGRPYVYLLYTYDHVLGEAAPAPRWGDPDNPVGDFCDELDDPDVDDCPVSGRLVRLTAVGDHAATTGVGALDEHVLVEDWCQQFSSHSIGDLQFDAGGALYASGGDGASFNDVDYGQYGWPAKNQCGDPPGGIGALLSPPTAEGGALRAQDLRTSGDPVGLDGSIIRIDPDSGAGLPGNPLFETGSDANAKRIVAYGFRNPFRFVVDSEHQEIYTANVGWNKWEEIDRFPQVPNPPFNSGWPCWEGPEINPSYQGLGLNICKAIYSQPGSTSQPFFSYQHKEDAISEDQCEDGKLTGSAVSGMALYPDSGPFPDDYDGALFFADSVRGCMYVVLAGDDGRPDASKVANFMWEGGLYPGVDLEVGPDGNLYYVRIFSDDDEGTIHRVSFDPNAPFARIESSQRYGPLNLKVDFDGTSSTDPQAGPLSYAWDLDGDGQFDDSNSATPSRTYSVAKNITVSLQVEDNEGKTSRDAVVVYPGDTPPQPLITAPSPTLTWAVGQDVEFAGHAVDSEEPGGLVAPEGLRWSTRILHCPAACHAHPYQGFSETATGTLRAPDHDYPAKIEFVLTATDARGLSASQTLLIDPRAVTLRIVSDPPGVTLGAGPKTAPGPFELTAIEGGRITLTAPPSTSVGGVELPFEGWSDGGELVHSIVAASSATYTASYGFPPVDTRRGAPTRLRGHPPKRTRSRVARFAFHHGGEHVAYRCRLDGKPYAPCRSPRVYRNLAVGRHTFRVLAVDAEDGSSLGAVRLYRWRVQPPLAPPRR